MKYKLTGLIFVLTLISCSQLQFGIRDNPEETFLKEERNTFTASEKPTVVIDFITKSGNSPLKFEVVRKSDKYIIDSWNEDSFKESLDTLYYTFWDTSEEVGDQVLAPGEYILNIYREGGLFRTGVFKIVDSK